MSDRGGFRARSRWVWASVLVAWGFVLVACSSEAESSSSTIADVGAEVGDVAGSADAAVADTRDDASGGDSAVGTDEATAGDGEPVLDVDTDTDTHTDPDAAPALDTTPPDTPNAVPIAEPQQRDLLSTEPIAVTLAATDADGDALTYSIVTPPNSGVLDGTPPAVTYTPNADYEGWDRFEFSASDGTDTSEVAEMRLRTVAASAYRRASAVPATGCGCTCGTRRGGAATAGRAPGRLELPGDGGGAGRGRV